MTTKIARFAPVRILIFLLKTIYHVIEAVCRLVAPANEKSVAGETVLISGAGDGIGKELAFKYASLGAIVVCWDINEANNEKTVKQINDSGRSIAYGYKCDISSRNEVILVADRVKKEVGIVTILVNNAGILSSKPFLDHKTEEINNIIDVNVKSQFWTVQAFLPDMLESHHGHVVSISSLAGMIGTTNLSVYSASKFAVRGFMESLREEFRASSVLGGVKSKINFTTILPFFVNTKMAKNVLLGFPDLTPVLSPKEVAARVVSAQRRNMAEVSIPSYWLYANEFIRLFPVKVKEATLDLLETGLGTQD